MNTRRKTVWGSNITHKRRGIDDDHRMQYRHIIIKYTHLNTLTSVCVCVCVMISEKVKCYWSVLTHTTPRWKTEKRGKKHLTYYFFDLFIFYMSHIYGGVSRTSGWCEYNMEIIQQKVQILPYISIVNKKGRTDIVACTHLISLYKKKLFIPNEKCIFICQMVYISFF